jgi:hypothetical protein
MGGLAGFAGWCPGARGAFPRAAVLLVGADWAFGEQHGDRGCDQREREEACVAHGSPPFGVLGGDGTC